MKLNVTGSRANAGGASGFYDAAAFWDGVLSDNFDLTGTGHGGHGPRYNRFLYRAKARALRRALAAAGVEMGGRSVIDVGFGVGFFTRLAIDAGCSRYMGLDISETAVERLRDRYPTAAFDVADIGAEELPDGVASQRFDLVLCFDVLYHIVDPARFARSLENLWSLVNPGGHLLIVDAFGEREYIPTGTLEQHGTFVPHVRFHKRADYDRLLFSRLDAAPPRQTPMYFLFNRPVEGGHWPWTSKRLAWHIRRRLLESRPVLWGMYAIDAVATRVRRRGADLKLVVVQKLPEERQAGSGPA